jgi:predicted CXXCH cytochrome family protein
MTTRRNIVRLVVAGVALVALVAFGSVYLYVVHGGMRARQKPSPVEAFVAARLIKLGIPAAERKQKNPFEPPTMADLVAGRDLYQRHCDVCHGHDGKGGTLPGGGMYPPPASLESEQTSKRTDGELFYLIRNGIRNTAMPGWQLPDRDTWQLVAYVRALPRVPALFREEAATPPSPEGKLPRYVGSVACKECHREIYDRWKVTRMANVVRDPREHPDAITPDLSKPDPLVTFTVDDIAFVYGSRWKQRYFKKIDGDYYPLQAQWDVVHKGWRPYFVKADWWAPLYPPDNMQRPTSALCDGCHSVNFDIEKRSVTEWNVGCERCHGPGGAHVDDLSSTSIVNPARLDYVGAADVCIQCHSQGRPPQNPIAGKYYDWPVGFHVGLKLRDYWKLEDHKLGETTFTHFADGTAHKNRMQGNDYVTSLMYTHGVSCFTCHDAHGSPYDGILRKPADVLCLDCHGPTSPNGPRAPTIEEHTHHKAGSPGNQCIACHMPQIAETIPGVYVRSHTFHFVTPAATDSMKIPNACNGCHTDKSTAWAQDALKSWKERSPWRMAE